MSRPITQIGLKKILKYFPLEGIFVWRVRKGTRGMVGKVAGYQSVNHQYIHIQIDGEIHLAHRIAWLYVHGEYPPNQIDHIDGNGLNNRIENLRCVTHRENMMNSKKPSNNASGTSGVNWCKRCERWCVRIGIGGKRKHLGYFKGLSKAVDTKKLAEREYGYHVNHGREL